MSADTTSGQTRATDLIRVYRRVSAVAFCACLLAGCGGPGGERIAAGDAQAGRVAIERYQCGVCHLIPGIAGARGHVGPSLDAYAKRVYIAGKLPQDSALLARWIQDAPSLAPGTAMPNVGVTEQDARDIAAYLYRLH